MCALPFNYQSAEATDLKELKFPNSLFMGGGERLRPAPVKRVTGLLERFYTVLLTCLTTLQARLEPRQVSDEWVPTLA